MRIVIAGPKGVGKSTTGQILGQKLGIGVVEADEVIQQIWLERSGKKQTIYELYRHLGDTEARNLEHEAVTRIAQMDWCIISVGGSTLLNPKSRRLLRPESVWVFLDGPFEEIWARASGKRLPAYLEGVENPQEAFARRIAALQEIVRPACDCVIDTTGLNPTEVTSAILTDLEAEFACRAQAPNTLGQVIRLTTFGESHGPMIGAVMDGLPPGIALTEEDIQRELDRRRPGQDKIATQRKESDRVKIVSGLFEGKTTGTAIAMLIENADSKSDHYEAIKDLFRPGHADFTFWKKYGIRDYKGGGRSSGRETACRVAGGAIAKKILEEHGVQIRAYTTRIGTVEARQIDHDQIANNKVRCPDPQAAVRMEQAILEAQSQGNSVGGIIQLEVTGIPAGLGDPVFGKLDARLAMALVSIGSVKGVEFGSGFAATAMFGSENNDPMHDGHFTANNAGGVLGGISTGEPVIIRIAVKPTPSISLPQQTCNTQGENCEIRTHGRHDPCIVPRAIPVAESMTALVLLDLWEIQDRIRPGWTEVIRCDKRTTTATGDKAKATLKSL